MPVRPDAYVFFLPPSPSDTNPPLGPAILARRAHELGLSVAVRDLNIEFINRYRRPGTRETYSGVGDHGKDRRLVAEAASALFAQFGVLSSEVLHRPDVGDPNAGMHYTFSGVNNALLRHLDSNSPLTEWLDRVVEEMIHEGPPNAAGVSVMGPSQVFCSLLLLRILKKKIPSIVTVIGGSHVTLLHDLIRSSRSYSESIDVVLPGHSEDEWADLLLRLRAGDAEGVSNPVKRSHPHFPYVPDFDAMQLKQYPSDALTLPLQFTRGCSYARCTYCTYPVVEPVATRLYAEDAAMAVKSLLHLHGIRQFSLKDSLLTVPMMTAFAEGLASARVEGIRWSATTKISRALIPRLQQLAASGLVTLEFGVESILPKNQELIDKRASLAQIEDVLLATREAGITPVVNLMFGFPGEAEDEALQQLHWASDIKGRLKDSDFSLNMVEIVRGSPMEKRVTEYGIIGIAPWAYSYEWTAPSWRRRFVPRLEALERRQAHSHHDDLAMPSEQVL